MCIKYSCEMVKMVPGTLALQQTYEYAISDVVLIIPASAVLIS